LTPLTLRILKLHIPIVLLLLGLYGTLNAQIEVKGKPRSQQLGVAVTELASVIVAAPDRVVLDRQDFSDAMQEKPYRIGVTLPVNLTLSNCGDWRQLPDGGSLWMLKLRCEGAAALGLDYKRFYLPNGADLYISNSDYSHCIGGFTRSSCVTGNSFSTRPVSGQEIVVELYLPAGCYDSPEIEISGINYIYRGWDFDNKRSSFNFGGSGPCEINVSCDEGTNWQLQANGVVRILSRVKNQSFWCTGSLMNNTNLDFSPLILTADHCSRYIGYTSSEDDLDKWIFYFNYASVSCDNPIYEPVEHSIVGAVKLASSQNPDDIGSDFFLIQLNQIIPPAYNAYYNGWSHEGIASPSGVCLHHPQGDIMKISTYISPLTSATWQAIPGTHWGVAWAPTPNGYGVTEPGSSGSPIFDANGLVVGQLTGGESGCSNTSGNDYFGKLSYSWISNGQPDSMQLRPWLDPLGDGRLTLEGAFNDRIVISDFRADTTTIVVGGTLDFNDLSLRNPTAWEWYFEGATPSFSIAQNPHGIRYDTCGVYSVRLTVSNQYGSDSLVKNGYIQVKANVYPNPTNGRVTIFTNNVNAGNVKVSVFNEQGQLVKSMEWNQNPGASISFELPGAGKLFLIRMVEGDHIQTYKVLLMREVPE